MKLHDRLLHHSYFQKIFIFQMFQRGSSLQKYIPTSIDLVNALELAVGDPTVPQRSYRCTVSHITLQSSQ